MGTIGKNSSGCERKAGHKKLLLQVHGACPTSIIGRNVCLGKGKLSTLSVPELDQRAKSKKDGKPP
jgi:hypothetical protein